MTNQYDYIITGSGAAGLSIAIHLINDNLHTNKRIAIIDSKEKNVNDRTWCFWEKETGLFEPIVYKKWKKLSAAGSSFNKEEAIAPYTYKMIRGIDFYEYCINEISKHNEFVFIKEEVKTIANCINGVDVTTNQNTYNATYVFNSILFEKPELSKKQNFLWQHFKGWIIETDKVIFDATVATYMDFNIPQTHGTSFVYVLPFSATKALVEYTLFTDTLLNDSDYNDGLKRYLQHNLQIDHYKVIEEEKGKIPMTDYKFAKANGNIINIGTAGGATRGSTGYTFTYIQKMCAAIVTALQNEKHPSKAKTAMSKLAKFYDAVFLQVLANCSINGQLLFCNMLQKRKIKQLLSFLDDENNIANDLSVIFTQPKLPFIKAAFKKLL